MTGNLALVPNDDESGDLTSHLEITPEIAKWLTSIVRAQGRPNGHITIEWRDYYWTGAETSKRWKLPDLLKGNIKRSLNRSVYGTSRDVDNM